MSIPSQIFQKQKQNQSKSEIIWQYKSNEDNLSFIHQNIKRSIIIKQKPIDEQIIHLQTEIRKLDEEQDEITKEQKFYTKSQLKIELISLLKQSQQGKSIIMPEINQRIEKDNPELMFYVLKECLARDQNRELLLTEQQFSCGFDSLIGVYGDDQECFKFRTQEVQYDQLIENDMFRDQYLTQFRENVSKILNICTSEVEILDIKKGSSIILFKIKSIKDLHNISKSLQFLEENLNGDIEIFNYFVKVQEMEKQGLGLSRNDFDSRFNMVWDHLLESEKRGPQDHRYDYYFPKGCYGYGLNIIKYGEDQEWIKMNGNKNEWRIMFHGTKNWCVNQIIKTNLKVGENSFYQYQQCIDEFGKTVQVGNGIYFSDQFNVCFEDGYASPVQVQNKKFAAIFMSRVNPKKIRQSEDMKKKRYFLINNSEDVRPYRLLIYEVK
ncbi:unnamed protein product [Paramecium sonneborni]|uniref:Uncharacterized protein n=1 Tax=Paramecium sonneborni TaxID=65129 RepID=A0A8S1QDB4_9CILI|nr:unnamed protein product [Paramecium sonneborni]